MTRQVFCQKMQKEAEGLTVLPYPGELGKKIYFHICQEAWQQWLQRQTILINEYRLNLADVSAQEMLEKEMERFFFGDDAQEPGNYIPK